MFKDTQSTLTVDFSIIGIANGLTLASNVGNRTGTAASPFNPMLGPLANNGGPTRTHALLVGSPAIDAGDPSAAAGVGDVPLHDQRGAPFTRVFGGRIDMGAFEFQTVSGPSADFDADGDVDGNDFLQWQRGLGAAGAAATRASGNADDDEDVDGDDLTVWKSQFGTGAAAVAASQTAVAAVTAIPARSGLSSEMVDAAMAYHRWLADDAAPQRTSRLKLLRRR